MHESAFGLARDSEGNAYVTGRGPSEIGGDDDILTLKLDKDDGEVVWLDREGGADQLDDRGWSIVVGPDDQPVVTGICTNEDGSADFITFKLDASDGSLLWKQVRPGAVNNLEERAGWLAVCDNGDVVMANRTWQPSTSFDIVLQRYAAATGDTVWTERYDSPESRPDDLRSMVRDRAGHLLVAGVQSGDILGLEFDPEDGSVIWSSTYDGPGSGYDTGDAILEGPGGEVLVTGFATSATTGWDAVTLAFDPSDGGLLWDELYDGGQALTEEGGILAVHPDGHLYVVGYGYGLDTDSDLLSLHYRMEAPAGVAESRISEDALRASPNPFTDRVELSLADPGAAPGRLLVFDSSGRRRFSRSLAGGSRRILWDGRDDAGRALEPGVYLARVEHGGLADTRKLVLAR